MTEENYTHPFSSDVPQIKLEHKRVLFQNIEGLDYSNQPTFINGKNDSLTQDYRINERITNAGFDHIPVDGSEGVLANEKLEHRYYSGTQDRRDSLNVETIKRHHEEQENRFRRYTPLSQENDDIRMRSRFVVESETPRRMKPSPFVEKNNATKVKHEAYVPFSRDNARWDLLVDEKKKKSRDRYRTSKFIHTAPPGQLGRANLAETVDYLEIYDQLHKDASTYITASEIEVKNDIESLANLLNINPEMHDFLVPAETIERDYDDYVDSGKIDDVKADGFENNYELEFEEQLKAEDLPVVAGDTDEIVIDQSEIDELNVQADVADEFAEKGFDGGETSTELKLYKELQRELKKSVKLPETVSVTDDTGIIEGLTKLDTLSLTTLGAIAAASGSKKAKENVWKRLEKMAEENPQMHSLVKSYHDIDGIVKHHEDLSMKAKIKAEIDEFAGEFADNSELPIDGTLDEIHDDIIENRIAESKKHGNVVVIDLPATPETDAHLIHHEGKIKDLQMELFPEIPEPVSRKELRKKRKKK
ncbi:MAG: hypothetical protein LBN08_00820 [Lactobacillales bacterium]|jgi:hypothetical protein|nr:hypothetical protein [Lactobacillales bacterium]